MGSVFALFLRYLLLALMALTAHAAHRRYRVATSWLPNLAAVAVMMTLPETLRALFNRTHQPRNTIEDLLITMVRDNPAYALYVIPFALGAIGAHPNYNLYKSPVRFAGFGLDALPHAGTHFALTTLLLDTFERVGGREAYQGWVLDLLRLGRTHPALTTLGVLAVLTLIWEVGEYQIREYEVTQANGDLELVNMEWSVENTVQDVISNLVGWAVALLWRRGR